MKNLLVISLLLFSACSKEEVNYSVPIPVEIFTTAESSYEGKETIELTQELGIKEGSSSKVISSTYLFNAYPGQEYILTSTSDQPSYFTTVIKVNGKVRNTYTNEEPTTIRKINLTF